MTDKEKEKSMYGISVCHREQGYSANQRPYSLIMKSNEMLSDELITVDIIKSLKHIAVKLTFEDFLNKFFSIYYSDAEMLTKLMGFETNLEIEAMENPTDEWLQDYNERHQEWLDDRLENITILKSAVLQEKELTLPEEYKALLIQKAFEDAISKEEITFVDMVEEEVIEEETIIVEEPITKSKTFNVINRVKEKEDSVSTDIQKSTKEIPEMAENTNTEAVDIFKSKEYLELKAELLEFKKAKEEEDKLVFIAKAKDASFLQETEQDLLAVALVKSSVEDKESHDALVLLIEKSNKALADKDAEIVELKKSFGEKEHGKDGDVGINTANAAQSIINAKIEKAKKEREAK